MKLNNIYKFLLAGVVVVSVASCHNKEKTFPDFEGGVKTYFAYQYPVRTIVLGESKTYETVLDNQKKFIIYGTMGGAYKGKDLVVDVSVDESLAENMYFADGSPVKAMPSSYYSLLGNQLVYGGNFMGGVEVQLTDAFFADPDAIKNTYVIPVVMDKVSKGDATIAAGTPIIDGSDPVRTNPALWNVSPKDYTLYCVKYINPWDGSWIRRGVDNVTEIKDGESKTAEVVRHADYVENDEVSILATQSLNSVTLPVSTNVTFITDIKPGYALKMSNVAAKENAYETQVWYQFDAPLEKGKEYLFSLRVKGSVAYDVAIYPQAGASGSGNQQFDVAPLSVTTEWTEKTISFTPSHDDIDKLTFNIGTLEGEIIIDDVSCVQKGSTKDLVTNGDFENGNKGGWSSWSGAEQCLNGIGYYVPGVKEEQRKLTCNLLLTFDDKGDCVIESATDGLTATGTGKYVKDGEKLAWGNKDRDGIYLDYTVNYSPELIVAAKDTLVSRSRDVSLETYVPTYNENAE